MLWIASSLTTRSIALAIEPFGANPEERLAGSSLAGDV
jgi:hypothetical protein